MLVAATCSLPPSSLEVTGEVTGRVWLHLDTASMAQSEGESHVTRLAYSRLYTPEAPSSSFFCWNHLFNRRKAQQF